MDELWIGLAGGNVIVGVNEIVHIGGADSHAQIVDGDIFFALPEQFFEQLPASWLRHPHQQLRRASGERVSKSVDRLVDSRLIDDDGIILGGPVLPRHRFLFFQ